MPGVHRPLAALRVVGLLALVSVLAIAGCTSAGTVQIPGAGPLVTVQLRGGMCPVGPGTQRVASCEVDIDWGHPLFVAVGAALGEWVPLPLT